MYGGTSYHAIWHKGKELGFVTMDDNHLFIEYSEKSKWTVYFLAIVHKCIIFDKCPQ